MPCFDDPRELSELHACVWRFSKNLKGSAHPREHRADACKQMHCKTLHAASEVKLHAHRYDCDEGVFDSDGDLLMPNVDWIFRTQAGGRGVGAARFRYRARDFTIDGTMTGIINASTFRKPLVIPGLIACPMPVACELRGSVEGQLCGEVTEDPNNRFPRGARLVASLRWWSEVMDDEGPVGGVTGTLEGVLLPVCG